MRQPLAIIASAFLLIVAAGVAALAAQADNRSGADKPQSTAGTRQFVGYWMGIDPLDGGDSRRAITRNRNGSFAVIGRDTVFTLCDGTDRAIVTVAEARLAGSGLVSDDLLIRCTNGSTVRLKVRYHPVAKNIVRETVTSQTGEPVDEIIFHRVSAR